MFSGSKAGKFLSVFVPGKQRESALISSLDIKMFHWTKTNEMLLLNSSSKADSRNLFNAETLEHITAI